MSEEMENLFTEYGCYLDKFIDPDILQYVIDNFNKAVLVDNLKYTLCKDDAGVFVLVTTRYVIKIYRKKSYDKVVNIYNELHKNVNSFEHIEKIYYYFSVIDGVIIHDTYSKYNYSDNYPDNIKGTGHLTINELLLPLFPDINRSNIVWNKDNVKKLLIDTSLALIELHKINIVHGDTTPDNIGLRISDNNYVLYDFGDAYKGFDYRSDVNRFLNSILITYKSFFQDYLSEIEKIKAIVNEGIYGIYDFYLAINTVL